MMSKCPLSDSVEKPWSANSNLWKFMQKSTSNISQHFFIENFVLIIRFFTKAKKVNSNLYYHK